MNSAYSPFKDLTETEKDFALSKAQEKIENQDFCGAVRILQAVSWKNPLDRQLHQPLSITYNLYCQFLKWNNLLGSHENVIRAALAAPTVSLETISIARDYFTAKTGIEFQTNVIHPRMFIGKYTYGSPNVYSWGAPACIFIDRFCSIAGEVSFLTDGNHSIDTVTTYPFFNPPWSNSPLPAENESSLPGSKGDIAIGSDVWIGHGATIMSGVTLGVGSVIAAKSVVAKAVPPYSVVAGNPARVVKYRFADSIVEKLLKSQWWTWSEDVINDNLKLIMSSKVDEFLEVARRRNEVS